MATELQKDRNRQHFIAAAKQLVIRDGVAKLTVRKIAEQAGFSYATLYNYFRDLDALLWQVALSFIDELVQQLTPLLQPQPFTLRQVQAVYRSYVDFCLQRPHVLQLIVAQPLGAPPAGLPAPSPDPQLAPLLLAGLEDPRCRQLREDERRIVARIITSSLHGMLMLYLSDKTAQSPEALRQDVDAMLEQLLLDRHGP